MKLLIASILACSISVSAMAKQTGSEDPKASVSLKKVDESKIQLTYGTIPEGVVRVKIYDDRKFLIQNDRIMVKKAFSKKYDFSKIKDGKYQVEVYDHSGLVEQLALDFTEPKTEPVIYSNLKKVDDGKFKLVVNSLLPTNMTVSIYENDRLIHEEKLEDVRGFQKLYIFNKINPKNELTFYVKSDNGFSEMVAIR